MIDSIFDVDLITLKVLMLLDKSSFDALAVINKRVLRVADRDRDQNV